VAANTVPIFVLTPNIGIPAGPVLTANTALDGTGTSVLLFTAGANGSRIDEIRIYPLGTNVATVLRIFINNGSTTGTATNNSLAYEITIPANTLSQVAQATPLVMKPGADQTVVTSLPIDGLILPAGYKLYATVGTTIAAGVNVTVLGGNF